MKVKERSSEFLYSKGSRISCTKILELEVPSQGKKIFKFSYRSYNGGEDFNGEIFDGSKLNHIFSMEDLGAPKAGSPYLLFTEMEANLRIAMLTKKGESFIQKLF